MTRSEIQKLIDYFVSEYSETKTPIQINFRQLVPEINNNERYTNLIHQYPAKLLSNIPYFFLQSDLFCPKNGVVLDPFCGSGTVMLEANISGRNAYGADANPLAVLIAQVKTTYISSDILLNTLDSVIVAARKNKCKTPTNVELIKRWFSLSTIHQLARLKESIDKIKSIDIRRFFLVSFSNMIKKVSFADPSISVPVKLNSSRFADNPARRTEVEFKIRTLQCIDVYEKFEDICKLNIRRLESLRQIGASGVKTEIVSNDARFLMDSYNGNEPMPDESVDLILTSPPYAGAQKYIRSSWLNLYWLGKKNPEEIRNLKKKNIGREDYLKAEYQQKIKTGIKAADIVLESLYNEDKKERAYIVGNYLNEMKMALDESSRVLKKGGYMIIVIGNNTVCNRPFDTQDYLTTYLQSKGMQLQFKLIDDIKSYGLMTKRNKTANRISCEWILVLKK
ncbi:DNA methyltransferase [uncultured Alistipes sp.]|uniref:DNA methyltransferase n=1 Tax=uncultured Alistipes sp. TaxID=538949 RepID=UPI0026667710|nr:DNA methyltransferase [uncultured Alistipes sp.]